MSKKKDNPAPDNDVEEPSLSDDVFEGLTTQQQSAIIALLENPTVVKAAEASSVSERTLRRWMSDSTFSKAFRKARRESFSHAISIGAHYAAHAMQTLGMVMTDRTVAAQSRVSAANAILKFGRDAIELAIWQPALRRWSGCMSRMEDGGDESSRITSSTLGGRARDEKAGCRRDRVRRIQVLLS